LSDHAELVDGITLKAREALGLGAGAKDGQAEE
jgi:hypothetical protein